MELQRHLAFVICVNILDLANCLQNPPRKRHLLSSSKSSAKFIFGHESRRPSFSRSLSNAGYYYNYEDPNNIIAKSFVSQHALNRNGFSRGIHDGLISDYFNPSGYQPEPNSWGRPSTLYLPQHPSTYSRNFFPCPKLEKALQRAKVNFNLAVDDKWNGVSKVEATIFRQDLTTLCNVIRSEFHRASEKLRKSGQYSCGNQESFYEAVSVAFENLVAHHSEGEGWYRRLRRFVGAKDFHFIINDIPSREED